MKGATVVCALISLLLASCANPTPQGQKHILVTFYPLLDITQEIAGTQIPVESLIPPGVEAHEYDPKVSDIKKLNNALLFVRIGLEWAPMEEHVSQNAATPSIIVSDNVTLLRGIAGGAIDPHIWLSPREMMIVAQDIANGLMKTDPANAARYQENLEQVEQKLRTLDDEYRTGLSNCAQSTIIVSHLAFSYVANDYGFTQYGLAGLSPEADISPAQLSALIGVAKEKGLHTILMEQLVDPRISETLASEIGGKALIINHLDVQKPGEDYFSQMRQNLQTLRIALECK